MSKYKYEGEHGTIEVDFDTLTTIDKLNWDKMIADSESTIWKLLDKLDSIIIELFDGKEEINYDFDPDVFIEEVAIMIAFGLGNILIKVAYNDKRYHFLFNCEKNSNIRMVTDEE